MAIQIRFDSTGNPILPTLLLAKKNGDILGLLDPKTMVLRDPMNDAAEMTFDVYKELNGVKNHLWDEIIDFRLLWCKEWNKWFEIKVNTTEENSTVKSVSCKGLGESELSFIKLFGVEINTETDIQREDYKIPTQLYYPEHPEASLLDRILADKCPHYIIKHVDHTVMGMQRTFTFDDVSIYEAFQEIAEECGVLFIIDVERDSDGKLVRAISVYDLENYCNACGHRGYFEEECPQCGSTDIHEGYGEDTTIFVSSDELGNQIESSVNTDQVFNCFKLVAGDDLMTSTIRNCNPNGTDYIWRIREDSKKDMSEELVSKTDEYNQKYEYYQNEHQVSINSSTLSDYNSLINKYKQYNEDLTEVSSPIVGYAPLMQTYYDVIDLELYLRSALMPDIKLAETNAEKELGLLNSTNLSPVSVSNLESASKPTVDSAVLAMAKVIVSPNFQTKIVSSTYENAVWSGRFKITNYSDEEDTATHTSDISVTINDDYTAFVKQKLDRCLKNAGDEKVGIVQLFDLSLEEFKEELKKYCLVLLTTFHDACQACLDILIEQGAGDKSSWENEEDNDIQEDLYNNLYVPYYEKLQALESEMGVRQSEIDIVTGVYDSDGTIKSYGMKTYIVQAIQEIQEELNFEKFLGAELWKEFSSFRRETKYQNENYISDGLTNAELIKNAQEFLELANKEIYKSSELQHVISGSLKNLLFIERFKPIVDYFKVGNWIRVKVDDVIYKLRLLDYEIDFENTQNIQVTFSDVIKTKDGCYDVKSILDQAKQMSSSYDSVKKQAGQGSESNNILHNWFESGLDATATKIVNSADNVTMSWDSHGVLLRMWDEFLEEYDPRQLKIINATMAITDDNWQTIKTAIGRFYWRNPVTGELVEAYGVNAETIVGKFIIGKNLAIYNNDMTFKVNEDGLYLTNGTNTIIMNPSDKSLFTITNKDNENVISMDEDGNANYKGHVNALSLSAGGKTSKDANSNGLFIGSDGAVYAGYNNQVIINPDGTFNFANDGIIYKDDNLTVRGAVVAKTLTAGEKTSKDEVKDGLFIDTDGSIYVGSQNGVIINHDGSFNFGKDGIVYDGTNVTFGEHVSLTWSNISDADSHVTQISKDEISTAKIKGEQIYAGVIKSVDGTTTIINLDNGTFSFANGKLAYEEDILRVNGIVTATELKATEKGNLACWMFNSSAIYKDNSEYGNASGMYFGTSGLSIRDKFKVSSSGALYASEAEISGKIISSSGEIGGFLIGSSYIRNGSISGVTNTSVSGVYLGTDGLNISGGTPETTTYITKDGINIAGGKISSKNGAVSVEGKIIATSGEIGGCKIVDGVLQVSAANVGKVTADQISVGDFDNYATINPNDEDTMISIFGGTKVGVEDNNGNLSVEKVDTEKEYLMFCTYTPLKLKNGDELYYEFNFGNYDSSDLSYHVGVWFYDVDRNYVTSITSSAFTVEAQSWKQISKTIKISTNTITSDIKYFLVGIMDMNKKRIGVSGMLVKKKSSGALIVNGTITADKLTTDNIVGTNGWINLKDGKFDYGSGKLKWDGTTLSVKGTIETSSGKIGDWTIGYGITHDDTSAKQTVSVLPGTNSYKDFLMVRHGSEGSYTYPFLVRGDGSFYATDAHISGEITLSGDLKFSGYNGMTFGIGDTGEFESTDEVSVINTGFIAQGASLYLRDGLVVYNKGGAGYGNALTVFGDAYVTGNIETNNQFTNNQFIGGALYFQDKPDINDDIAERLITDWNTNAKQMSIGYGARGAGYDLKLYGSKIILDTNTIIGTSGKGLYGKHTDGSNMRMVMGTTSNAIVGGDKVNCVIFGDPDQRTYLTGKSIYATHSISTSSDKRLKENFTQLDDRYLQMIDLIEPILFNWKNKSIDNRKQIGYVAQNILNTMESCGISENENTIVNRFYDPDKQELGEIIGLNYESLGVVSTYALQDARKRIVSLESEIKELKTIIKRAGLI